MSNPPPAPPEISSEMRGSTLIVRPKVKLLDDPECKALHQTIDKAAASNTGVALIILDLADVQMIPSLGLGALVQISQKCKARQQRLKLAALRPPVRQTLSLTRLDRIFELTDTVDAAVE